METSHRIEQYWLHTTSPHDLAIRSGNPSIAECVKYAAECPGTSNIFPKKLSNI
jgi:hypothetical protein